MSDLIKREDAIKAVEECLKLLARPRYTVKTAIEAIPSVDIPHSDDWEKYSEKLWRNAYERGKEEEHRWWSEHCAKCTSADRPQGEWIEKNNGYDTTCECSVCHYRNFIPNYQVGSKYVCMDRYWFKRNFCPSCGARMKGADDGKDIQSEAE